MGRNTALDRSDGFDQDCVCQFFADTEAGIADLADEIGVASEQLYLLFLTNAEFAKTRGDIGRGGKLLDTDDGAGLDAAQWANGRAGALTFQDDELFLSVFHRCEKPRLIET